LTKASWSPQIKSVGDEIARQRGASSLGRETHFDHLPGLPEANMESAQGSGGVLEAA
jgi:hypothetical protein